MNTNNRYLPPSAAVGDVLSTDLEYQPIRLWPPSGRIGRLRFLAYSFGAYLVCAVIAAIVGFLAAAFGLGADASGVLIGVVSYGSVIAANLLLLIQRSHDMDMTGWTGLLAIIPFVGLYWVFKGGTVGPNRFGAPPPPNSLIVKIVAWLFPAIFVFGMVAAIALPAYQNYVTKAKAKAVQAP